MVAARVTDPLDNALDILWTAMDRVRAGRGRGSVILWIRKEEPSGGGVDGSRRLGGREDGDGERG